MIVAGPSRLFADLDVSVELDASLAQHTWFGIGGRADALVHPHSTEALATLVARCSRDQVPLRILGSGANLLVDDEGIDGVVVKLDHECFQRVEFNSDGMVERMRVHGGASMERLVQECARRGLRGIEQMAGIPASLGGAIRMNAGGKFGAIGDAVDAVAVLDRDGQTRIFTRDDIDFGYRHTSLPAGIVLWASLRVAPDDPVACRARVKEIFAYKKASQPMAANSAGCMFRNPTLPNGTRESAGKLIDLAGLKGTRVRSAFVSQEHGNFIAVDREGGGARTEDVRELVELVQRRVFERFGVELETEVVFWRRGEPVE